MELDYPELPQIDADSSELREIETRNICVSCQEITTDLFKCSCSKTGCESGGCKCRRINRICSSRFHNSLACKIVQTQMDNPLPKIN